MEQLGLIAQATKRMTHARINFPWGLLAAMCVHRIGGPSMGIVTLLLRLGLNWISPPVTP
jgi:hypothetical protein